MQQLKKTDWTANTKGAANSSDRFEFLCTYLGILIRNEAHALLAGQTKSVARLILATLSHDFGFTTNKTLAEMKYGAYGDHADDET